MDTLSLVFEQGLKLSGGILTFDRPDTGLCFISSAEVDGAWKARRPLCTDLTAALLRTVRREFRPLIMPYGRPTMIGAMKVTLLATGPMPGGAAVLVEIGGRRLLYISGKPDRNVQIPSCDLVAARVACESAFPGCDFQTTLVKSVRTAIGAGIVPVIRCNPFGPAQAVCAALSSAGVQVRQHRSIFRFNGIWRSRGCEMGLCRRLNNAVPSGAAVVLPAHIAPGPFEEPRVNSWRIGVVRCEREASAGAFDELLVLPGALEPSGVVEISMRAHASEVVLVGHGAPRAAQLLGGRVESVVVADSVQQGVLPLV
jgi:hypothetical protein